VKAQMRKIGIGESSVVRVKLNDGTELRGYLSQIENDSFTITDKATNKATSVSYGDVRSLKLKGKGLPTGAKVLIVVGIGVAVTAGVIAYLATHLKFGI
jgi:small nuclear ribonucleoprotein (snRNP)-like protein